MGCQHDDTNLCLNTFSKYFNNHIFREVNFIAHNISSIQDSNLTKPSNSKWTKAKIDWSDHWFSWQKPLRKTNCISCSGAFLVMQLDPNWNTIHSRNSHPSKPLSFTNMARSTPSIWRSWPNLTRSRKSSLEIETLPPSMRQSRLIWPSKQLNHGIWWSIIHMPLNQWKVVPF